MVPLCDAVSTQDPADTIVTVALETPPDKVEVPTAHTLVFAAKATVKPDVAVAVTTNDPSPYVLEDKALKVMACDALFMV
jgi:hypothetical protein